MMQYISEAYGTCPSCDEPTRDEYTFPRGVTAKQAARWEEHGTATLEEKALRVVTRCGGCGWRAVRKG